MEVSCSICMVRYVNGDIQTTLPCFHWFHKACVDEWLNERMSLGDKVWLVSKIFRPSIIRPWKTSNAAELVCKSHSLLLDQGLVEYAAGRGLFHILPVLHRSLEKLVAIIDQEMKAIGGSRLSMPLLCERGLWDKTLRWTMIGEQMFKLKDRRDTELCLCPTHEESVTQLIAQNGPLTSKQLPLLLYQFGWKFRDEANPRFGILRSREFLMKDLYSFDCSEQTCLESYRVISDAYLRVFQRMPLSVHVVNAKVGVMGGSSSHEYHTECSGGQDLIDVCQSCGSAFIHPDAKDNVQAEAVSEAVKCLQCGSTDLEALQCAEVAHTFVLGTKYSTALNARFVSVDGQRTPLHMGCYGIGVSRLLAASIDNRSTDTSLRWPSAIVPYKVCVIPPKRHSKESSATAVAEHIATSLAELPNLRGEVLLDDRLDLTVGRRLAEAKRLGWPRVVVVNKSAIRTPVPMFELVDVSDDTCQLVTHCELFQRLRQL